MAGAPTDGRGKVLTVNSTDKSGSNAQSHPSATHWLTPYQRRLHRAILRSSAGRGYTWKTQRELAKATGASPAAVCTGERALEAAGLISRFWPTTKGRRCVFFLRRARDIRLIVPAAPLESATRGVPDSLTGRTAQVEIDGGGVIPFSFLRRRGRRSARLDSSSKQAAHAS